MLRIREKMTMQPKSGASEALLLGWFFSQISHKQSNDKSEYEGIVNIHKFYIFPYFMNFLLTI